MRRHHARVARMELAGPAETRQLGGDLVDALAHDQHRSVSGLRQEIAERTVETAREHHPLSLLCDKGERAVDLEDDTGVGCEEQALSVGLGGAPESLRPRGNQIDDAGDWMGHGGAAMFGDRESGTGNREPGWIEQRSRASA